MILNKKIIYLFAIIVLLAMSLYATEYYVKNGGNDAASGLDDDNAWETIAKVNGESFSGDDIIYFKRGDTWREQLTVPDSGTSGHPITFGAYGEGADPIINAADVVSTWTEYYGTPETWAAWTMDVDAAGQGEYNMRSLIPNASFAASGDQIQIKLEGHTANQTILDSVYIGEVASTGDAWDMESGTITEITFASGSGVTIAAGNTATSDWVTYAFDKDKDYFISYGVNAATYLRLDINEGQSYYKADVSADAGTANVTDYTGINNVYFLDEMKVREAQSNTWQATLATEPDQVFFDGVKGTNGGSIAGCNSAREWYWAANVLYVYYTEDPDGAIVIEASSRAMGINLSDEEYLTIDGLFFKYTNNAGGGTSGAINEYNAGDLDLSDIIIKNCTFSYTGSHGIQINLTNASGTVDGLQIYNNTFSYCGDSGLGSGARLQTGNTAGFTNLLFYNNTSSNCQQSMLRLVSDSGGLIYLNSSDGDGQDSDSSILISANCTNTKIYRNTLKNNATEEGIWLGSSGISGVEIYYNLVYGNNTDGIYLDADSDNCLIYNNVIYDNVDGIVVNNSSCTGTVIKNNIVEGNSGVNILFAASVAYVGDYNCFDENVGFYQGGSLTFTQWKAAHAGDEGNSLYQDPLMTDPGSDDFTLQVGSPCINRGTFVGLILDYLGLPVPIGHRPDIGAYEHKNGGAVIH
ncbi:MAG: right-handed parallel beta-helix repeat-containing protein [Deltaproteobacteria bacterium]|nr:right-handed parallel beta-helix repeat-containing protein [Deltaproteobacteria bacterium]